MTSNSDNEVMERIYKQPTYLETFGSTEYASERALEKVPENEKTNMWSILSIWLGFVIYPGGFFAGALIGASVGSFATAALVIFAGCFILGCVAATVGYMGQQTGYNTYLLFKYMFGRVGSFFPTAFLWVTYVAWIGVISAMLSVFIDAYSPGLHSTVGMWFALVAVIPAAYGIRWLVRAFNVAVPALLLLVGYAVLLASRIPVEEVAVDIVPTMGIGQGIAIIVGTFVCGALANADFTRYLRKPWEAIAVPFITFAVGLTLLTLAGAYLATRAGVYDVSSYFVSLGLLLPATVMMALGLITTIDANTYSGSLQLKILFRRRITRFQATFIHGCVGGLVAAMGIYFVFQGFLMLISSLVPAVFGVIAADYFWHRKKKYAIIQNWWHIGLDWNIIPLVALVIGLIINYIIYVHYPTYILGGIPGIIGSAAAYSIINYLGPDFVLLKYNNDLKRAKGDTVVSTDK